MLRAAKFIFKRCGLVSLFLYCSRGKASMIQNLTDDVLLHVVSFLGVPDLLHLSQSCKRIRDSINAADGAVIVDMFKKGWGAHFAVWGPLFAVSCAANRLKTALTCEKLAAMCGCWTLLNVEGLSTSIRGGLCSVLPTVHGLRLCLIAPKRVCLDNFEWEDSNPLEHVDRILALQGRLELGEVIERAYLVDRILPAFTLDVLLMSPLPLQESVSTTLEARIIGREYTTAGEVRVSTMKSVSYIELFNELASYVEPCLPHHHEFYPPCEVVLPTEGQRRSHACDHARYSPASNAAEGSADSKMRDSSRYSLSRSDFQVLIGQLHSDRSTLSSPLPSLTTSSQARCSICSLHLPSRGIQCCPFNCSCARINRPLRLKIRFMKEMACYFGFICCTATLPRFDGADLLPLFNTSYPIAAPWLPSLSPLTAARSNQLDLISAAPCFCGVHGLWAGAYGPHGLEILCILQVNLVAAFFLIPCILI